ncbi:hypothetical protein FE236_02465 [Mariprofundus erugo]|uniref:hypothetical protein n=1 Tax=Mariprofundus erugo TaxID=2528639 RepID=UPI0010FD542D|nr:hypothetical protein [Mariprofundus erugo]TLS77973.1 hypothetical protein FE236_02465 [Mariprofundus erugo]
MNSETNMGKNIGFVFNSRCCDFCITTVCVALGGLGALTGHEGLVAFCVPAAIGLMRQAFPLLTFVYVVTIALSLGLTFIHLEELPRVLEKWPV